MRFQREYKKRLLMCSVLQESMRCAMGNFDRARAQWDDHTILVQYSSFGLLSPIFF